MADPSNLIAFAILCALRVRAEEMMMVEEFGDEYAGVLGTDEASHSWRLVDNTYRLPGATRHLAGSSASYRRVGLKLSRYDVRVDHRRRRVIQFKGIEPDFAFPWFHFCGSGVLPTRALLETVIALFRATMADPTSAFSTNAASHQPDFTGTSQCVRWGWGCARYGFRRRLDQPRG